MAMDVDIVGGSSGNKAEVSAANQLIVTLERNAIVNEANIGDICVFSEVDQGYITSFRNVASPEADNDYRLRASLDLLLDDEMFNYTAQNTGKYTYINTTMASTWAAGQFTTNSGNITTTTTGVVLQTYASFPIQGTQTLSNDTELAFTAQPSANTFIEWGFMIPGAQTVAPTDGVFFRLNSAGLQGISSFNGTEVSTGVFTGANNTGTWTYTNNKKYQFIVYVSANQAFFWANDGILGAVLLGSISIPSGTGRLCMANALPWAIKHRITGGAGGSTNSALLIAYSVRLGGTANSTFVGEAGNRMYGSQQGLSGGTMGSLATYANNTNPTAATPTNTSLVANLPGGIGGQGLINAPAAAATDLIINSYQVPVLGVNGGNRRLVLKGVRIDMMNMGAAVATTLTTLQMCLNYGHTAVSLATAEAANAKAPRRIPLGFFTWQIGAAIGAPSSFGAINFPFVNPIYVNPGEFLAISAKPIAGTATGSETFQYIIAYDYGWE